MNKGRGVRVEALPAAPVMNGKGGDESLRIGNTLWMVLIEEEREMNAWPGKFPQDWAMRQMYLDDVEDVFSKLDNARKHYEAVGLGASFADQFVQ